MKLVIDDDQKIVKIQTAFSKLYPYLKLQFYSRPHLPGSGSPNTILKQDHLTIGDCRTIHKKGKLTINPDMTVSDLEQAFGTVYGLGIQVFRKSGKVWLQTTSTDNWTLKKQNAEGQELSAQTTNE